MEENTTPQTLPILETPKVPKELKPREAYHPPWEELRGKLCLSKFRGRFKLRDKELRYIQRKGMEIVKEHALEFVTKKIAPATPAKDGKQTPMRGHPVFVSQHATATCCRGCLAKWHRFETGRPLTSDEINYIVGIILRWIDEDLERRRNLPQRSSYGPKRPPERHVSKAPFASAIQKRQEQQERYQPEAPAPATGGGPRYSGGSSNSGGYGSNNNSGIGSDRFAPRRPSYGGGGSRNGSSSGSTSSGGGERFGSPRPAFGSGGGGRPGSSGGGGGFRGQRPGGGGGDRFGSRRPAYGGGGGGGSGAGIAEIGNRALPARKRPIVEHSENSPEPGNTLYAHHNLNIRPRQAEDIADDIGNSKAGPDKGANRPETNKQPPASIRYTRPNDRRY